MWMNPGKDIYKAQSAADKNINLFKQSITYKQVKINHFLWKESFN